MEYMHYITLICSEYTTVRYLGIVVCTVNREQSSTVAIATVDD